MGGGPESATICFRPIAPIKTSQPRVKTRIVQTYHLQVAFEEGIVRHVEADECCVQANVGLGDMLPKKVGVVLGL